MPAGGLVTASVITGVSAIASIVRGVSQKNQANKLERNNIFNPYQISNQVYNNVNLAENLAQQGYESSTLAYLQDQNSRALQSSNQAVLQGGGNINNIGAMYDSFTQSNRAIALDDEKLKNSRITQLFQLRETLAEEEARKWSINDYSNYINTQAAISALRSDANKNISSGLNGAMNTGLSVAKGFDYKKVTNAQPLQEPQPQSQQSFETNDWGGVPQYNFEDNSMNQVGAIKVAQRGVNKY